MVRTSLFVGALLGLMGMAAQPAMSANVKITPLGAIDGEFCALDRAMVFEDPDGTADFYDAGRTVFGANDPRLGKIDGVLISHVHGDHLGDMHASKANRGECGKPKFDVKDVPTELEYRKDRGRQEGEILCRRRNEQPIRRAHPGGRRRQKPSGHSALRRHEQARRRLHLERAGGAPNGLSPAFLSGDLAKQMKANGLTAYVGEAGGYVLRFSNGLTAYLSGDTGVTAAQDVVVRRELHANLAVINIGDVFTTGPTEAAYVINELVKPASAIPSHANQASTKGGKVLPNSRTAKFIAAVKVPVHVPLSGKTMEFDGNGKCVGGC